MCGLKYDGVKCGHFSPPPEKKKIQSLQMEAIL